LPVAGLLSIQNNRISEPLFLDFGRTPCRRSASVEPPLRGFCFLPPWGPFAVRPNERGQSKRPSLPSQKFWIRNYRTCLSDVTRQPRSRRPHWWAFIPPAEPNLKTYAKAFYEARVLGLKLTNRPMTASNVVRLFFN